MATSNNLAGTNAHHGPQLDAHHLLKHGAPPTSRKASGPSVTSSNEVNMRAKGSANRPKAYSSSSHNTETSSSTHTENRDAPRGPRSLPPWIDHYEEVDEPLNSKATDRLLSSPSRAHPATHHHTPKNPMRRVSQDGYVDTYDDVASSAKKPEAGFFGGHREPVRGRKWDHARDGDPVIMQSGIFSNGSQWRTYIKSSMYGPGLKEDPKQVDQNFLQQQTPGYGKPWRGDLGAGEDPEKLSGIFRNKKKQRSLITRLQHNLLTHPLVPLIFRITVLTTSLIALGLSTSIHHLSNNYKYDQNASATMAIAVDVVAIPYILYVTWDEYTGKPLGLRSPKAKIRLVLLDLFFIIFESANLALAFAALTDSNGSCTPGPANGPNQILCGRVNALCGILMVALIAWSLTFAVSIFRLVERVGGREDVE